MKTRIAPTPNGHLHLGNIFNFIHIASEARRLGLKIALRIDDHDNERCKDEYIDEIFRALDFLKINIDEGPSSTDDFNRNYSQTLRKDLYKSFLEKIEDQFYCECSRREIFERNSSGVYSGFCKNKNLSFKANKSCTRYDCPREIIKFENREVDVKNSIGDIVLWRKEDIPSYQLVSVCDDIEMNISHIFRGEDLISSSAIQLLIAKSMKQDFIKKENIYHHQLVTLEGEKLSKSRKSEGAMELLESDPKRVFREYSLFMNKQVSESLEELISNQ